MIPLTKALAVIADAAKSTHLVNDRFKVIGECGDAGSVASRGYLKWMFDDPDNYELKIECYNLVEVVMEFFQDIGITPKFNPSIAELMPEIYTDLGTQWKCG